MKKRLLSLLMAMCLMATMVPAAFAADTDQPDTIWAHGQEVELPVVDRVVPENGIDRLDASGTRINQTIVVNTPNQFWEITEAEWRGNNTIQLNCDIDLSTQKCAEWDGYLKYLDGHLIGNPDDKPVISGFANNTYLFYGMIHGTISNITLQLDGNAGTLYYLPTVYSGSSDNPYYSVTIENVDTEGYVNLTSSDQANYSPYVFAACKGDFKMVNCTNNANITGDVYGSVFHGYYAMNTSGSYTFENCVNNGRVTLRNAAMFFGNPTSMNDKIADGSLDVTVRNCENNNIIAGSVSAHYFAPSLNSQDYGSDTALAEMDASMTTGTPAPVQEGVGGGLSWEYTSDLNGSIGEDGQITFSYSGNAAVDHFLVTVGSYVQIWNKNYEGVREDWDGTDRYSVSEEIAYDNNSTEYTAKLRYCGVADANYGKRTNVKYGNYDMRSSQDGKTLYYQIKQTDDTILYYATRAVTDEGVPAGGGCVAPSFASVYALDDQGNILSFFTFDTQI